MKPTPVNLLVIGSGEIARLIVQLAQYATGSVTVCDEPVAEHHWPDTVSLKPFNFSDRPWSLPENSHAIIARGHEGDAENLLALLHHHAEHVYLIASARRAQSLIDQTAPQLSDPGLLKRLSAPAGLNLGGQSSFEIALSILAEVQWRSNSRPPLQTLTELRNDRLNQSVTGQRNISCPGKRP